MLTDGEEYESVEGMERGREGVVMWIEIAGGV